MEILNKRQTQLWCCFCRISFFPFKHNSSSTLRKAYIISGTSATVNYIGTGLWLSSHLSDATEVEGNGPTSLWHIPGDWHTQASNRVFFYMYFGEPGYCSNAVDRKLNYSINFGVCKISPDLILNQKYQAFILDFVCIINSQNWGS